MWFRVSSMVWNTPDEEGLLCPAMRRWLGGDHAAFAAEYYILGNKINAFGDLYVYFQLKVAVHEPGGEGPVVELEDGVCGLWNDAEDRAGERFGGAVLGDVVQGIVDGLEYGPTKRGFCIWCRGTRPDGAFRRRSDRIARRRGIWPDLRVRP